MATQENNPTTPKENVETNPTPDTTPAPANKVVDTDKIVENDMINQKYDNLLKQYQSLQVAKTDQDIKMVELQKKAKEYDDWKDSIVKNGPTQPEHKEERRRKLRQFLHFSKK